MNNQTTRDTTQNTRRPIPPVQAPIVEQLVGVSRDYSTPAGATAPLPHGSIRMGCDAPSHDEIDPVPTTPKRAAVQGRLPVLVGALVCRVGGLRSTFRLPPHWLTYLRDGTTDSMRFDFGPYRSCKLACLPRYRQQPVANLATPRLIRPPSTLPYRPSHFSSRGRRLARSEGPEQAKREPQQQRALGGLLGPYGTRIGCRSTWVAIRARRQQLEEQ